MTQKAIVIDDEPPARLLIKEYLEDFPSIRVVAECKNGQEAIRAIHSLHPDLIFLDIQMPGMNGFELLQHLEYIPQIIFTTAYDQYALQAFDVNAVDYLLKPISRERFSRAVQKALTQKRESLEQLSRLLQGLPAKQETPLSRLFIRVGHKIIPVHTDEIVWIEAAGDYTNIHLKDRHYVCSLGIGALEKRLDPGQFVRVHRSTIIALRALDHLETDGEGGYWAFLSQGTRVRVSRSYAAKLRKFIL